MTTLLEVLERLARIDGRQSALDVVFQQREYRSRIPWLVTYEMGTVTKLGGRVIVELREVQREHAQ